MEVKKFTDMTEEEKKEAFDKWFEHKTKANEDPVKWLTGSITDALQDYIPNACWEDACCEVEDTVRDYLEEVRKQQQ